MRYFMFVEPDDSVIYYKYNTDTNKLIGTFDGRWIAMPRPQTTLPLLEQWDAEIAEEEYFLEMV